MDGRVKTIKILERDNWTCQRCGNPLHVKKTKQGFINGVSRIAIKHHIVHRCDGGTNTVDNLMSSCKLCERTYHAAMGGE